MTHKGVPGAGGTARGLAQEVWSPWTFYEAAPVAVLTAPARSAALSPDDVADAKAAIQATYRRPDTAGVCVADGFGVKVTVAHP